MPQARIFTVDAFTDEPFSGNPAAVCLLDAPAAANWMQRVAAEMNLAETAFLVRRRDDDFDLRWFTPAVEVPLCGHATLASAHVLWTAGEAPRDLRLAFHTRSGVLRAEPWPDGRIALDFPAFDCEPTRPPAEVIAALGAEPCAAHRTARQDREPTLLLEYADEAQVRALRPEFSPLERWGGHGVIATARAAGADFDFVSRFFAPGAGIPEDPVTGFAHCCLAPYWAQRLGKRELAGYQASARGGSVGMQLEGERVRLLGSAVSVLEGRLRV